MNEEDLSGYSDEGEEERLKRIERAQNRDNEEYWKREASLERKKLAPQVSLKK